MSWTWQKCSWHLFAWDFYTFTTFNKWSHTFKSLMCKCLNSVCFCLVSTKVDLQGWDPPLTIMFLFTIILYYYLLIPFHVSCLYLWLHFPEKPFIEIKEPWLKVWEVNVGDQTTLIPVKYSAYPEPSFKWCVHCRVNISASLYGS